MKKPTMKNDDIEDIWREKHKKKKSCVLLALTDVIACNLFFRLYVSYVT